MAAEDFDGHEERVLHKIVVHHAVEDVDVGVVTAAGEQRVAAVEGDLAQGKLVVSKRLVRFGTEIEIEPAEAAVKTANNNVVTLHNAHV